MKQIMLKAKQALLFACLSGNATTAWAADGGRHDNSGVFVGIFLAFCALIVAAQLIPAMLVLLGFARGVHKTPLPTAHQ